MLQEENLKLVQRLPYYTYNLKKVLLLIRFLIHINITSISIILYQYTYHTYYLYTILYKKYYI